MIADNRSQDAPFTIKGHWWLPGNSHKVAGDLIYNVEEMTLALYGGLNDAIVDTPISATPEGNAFPVIHGESLRGVPITVLRSFYTNWTPNVRTLAVKPGTHVGILSSRLLCHELVEGLHLSSQEDTFTKCRIEIPCLENWLGDSPFKFDMGGSGEHVRIDYTRPKNEEFSIPACECFVRFIRSVTPPGFPSHTPSIEHRAAVELAPFTPMPLNWFQTFVPEIVDLFSFLYGGSLQSRRLTLFTNTTGEDEATLYFSRPKVEPIEFETSDIVVRYESIRRSFSQVLANWLTASGVAKRARRILLSSELRPARFMERQFLRLMIAAEVLAKGSNQSTVVDQEAFDEVREQMFAVLRKEFPSTLIDSITIRHHAAKHIPLRSRLSSMLNDLQDETCSLFCIDKTNFIQGVVNARNYFTHYSPKKTLLQDVELYWATKKVSLMLRILLLLKAGVPEDDLQRLVRCHHPLSGDRTVWSTITEEGSPFGDADGN